ncbi:hypothetical protein BJX70DRAFT_262951 [Aspergillus crustosus]
MPPSTVFSYWRRRPNASPVPHASQPTLKASSPPQLPLIADSTTLAATFDEKFIRAEGSTSQAPTDYFLNFDGGTGPVSVSTIDALSPSTATLTFAPSFSLDPTRLRSSPDENDRQLSTTTPQSDISSKSPLPPTTPDQTNEGSYKPTSPFLGSSGKNILTPQAADSQQQRSTSPIMAPAGHRRFRTSPDVSPGDKVSASQREHRFEGPTRRRVIDHDVQPVVAEPVSQKTGKTMLHLLNPMSLLAKRRAHQTAGLRSEDVSKGSRSLVPAIPDDYDPRIRGHIVHDFSAPRPRRQLSAAPAPTQEQSPQAGPSSASPLEHIGKEETVRTKESKSAFSPLAEQGRKHSDHSPVFREHFEDDKRALQVENKAYLQSSLLTDPSNRDHDTHALPVFARKLPSSIADHPTLSEEQALNSQADSKDEELIKEIEDTDTVEVELPQQLSGLPKHFKSNASRFSFDMNGVGSSTQEKLLEEKHKEKEAARKAEARLNGEFSDVDDDYDNEMFDDLDGLEEEIPGVNVEADEEDEFRNFSGPGNILSTSWLAPSLSPVVASPVQPDMSISDGQVPPASEEKPDNATPSPPLSADMPVDSIPESSMTFLRESIDFSGTVLQPIPDEDDLYFDDGEFGELDAEGMAANGFDESIFDDPTSHLYERKPPSKLEAVQDPQQALSLSGELKHASSTVSEFHQGFAPRRYGSVAGNVPNPEPVNSQSGILSEHNLEAFHNALADAAHHSAGKANIGYTTSISERSLAQESSYTVDSQPGLVSDESRLSQAIDPVSLEEVFDDFNYDDDDDLFYDDPIIAAANAEALENDDEGFYGHEFGFYAQAYVNGSELTNGGYFGPRGTEGISRSHSGRGKFREPSLTPITERSEWSTRNSIISVAAHGVPHPNQSVPNPGLAQLVDMSNLDDELSLGALMKLRRDAWGGSNGSLRSSSGSPPPQPYPASNRGSFAFSDVSPTVHTFPPDFLGGPISLDSPVMDTEKGAYTHPLPPQRTERPTAGDGEPQI